MCSMKVLILEDNPFQLMVLHQMLNAFRIFDVLAAESVESARCSLAKSGGIDVAICDLHLEGLSGEALIRELAVKGDAQALIILSCAAPHVVESAIRTAREEGLEVLGYLPKPVTVNGLGRLLEVYNMRIEA